MMRDEEKKQQGQKQNYRHCARLSSHCARFSSHSALDAGMTNYQNMDSRLRGKDQKKNAGRTNRKVIRTKTKLSSLCTAL